MIAEHLSHEMRRENTNKSSSNDPLKRKLFVLLGFDCDRPRGDHIKTEDGLAMASAKLSSIKRISSNLHALKIPSTFFICGQFLEEMAAIFGRKSLAEALQAGSTLVEIGDHGYSHSILKKIPTRPEKKPITSSQAAEEFQRNTSVFRSILGIDIPHRGYRAPLGYYQGLSDRKTLLNCLLREGVSYISSDLRDSSHSLNPPLKNADGTLRQPYRYFNGLLEIPSVGWQDTAFSGTTKTPLFVSPPVTYNDIIKYYNLLINEATGIANDTQETIFMPLVMHPYDISIYDKDDRLLNDLSEACLKAGGIFINYGMACDYFK